MKKYSLLFLWVIFNFSICATAAPSVVYQRHLPRKMQVFLDRHFGKYEIEKLEYDAEDGECKVKYSNGIEVEFDDFGSLIEIESDYAPLPKSIIDILPSPAIDFIAKRYSQRPIRKIKYKSGTYKVKLGKSLEIIFDERGNVIEIDD
ncbi:hypothetical protein M2459_001668 [Parabacteroides sp. PF5-5]|uniref:PepSY-like domain-containing protein n=1 Tax=unclassified Parabacteroides TaxID=2649774 RepID=UPI0024741CD1|nr:MULTISPECIES: PepSY-like domain-containing protein [unclassified Parabacteroides]MDH6304931.1 hypothetical protein [Parabacteroides sp. PH5-39]MDH6315983.1 hypothetical protein [Parabacteroides sp. PF5-13]MDH6319640.1 hypothetical protein [Parabacteroides sp. PH5-13]MDH6323371.1 hypothetical protein [Parabacteroides sp. PH5-8]MDH6327120.1 hypothetical protein [Parabacteroides sp. PH5-41]